MPLNIKNVTVEKLATDLAQLTGESKTTVIRRALEERLQRLALRQTQPQRLEALRDFLRREVWPTLEGQAPITKAEIEQILGYGDRGV